MALIQITTKREPNFMQATDALFSRYFREMDIDTPCLEALKHIDKAEPLHLPEVPLTFFKTPFGCARYDELSSGVKCILLILHQLKHPELDWTLNFDSAGANAKKYIIEYLRQLPIDVVPFKLYCTVCDILDETRKIKCFISSDHSEPTTLEEITEGCDYV